MSASLLHTLSHLPHFMQPITVIKPVLLSIEKLFMLKWYLEVLDEMCKTRGKKWQDPSLK
jgi:hypothetical protein